VFVPSIVLYVVILLTLLISVIFYFDLLVRNAKCKGLIKSSKMDCN